jgi:hypothetical protein
MDQLGRQLGLELTEEMYQTIEDQADQLGIAVRDSALLVLPEILRSQGDEMAASTDQILGLMDAVASGSIPAVQGAQAIGTAWQYAREEAELAGRVGDALTRSMLQQARAAGGLTEEMQAYVDEALGRTISALDVIIARYEELEDGTRVLTGGLDLLAGLDLSGFDIGSGPIPADLLKSDEDFQTLMERARAQGTIFSGTFWAAVEESGLLGAADALREPFARMIENLGEVGIPQETIDLLYGQIGRLMDLTAPATEESLAGPLRAALETADALQQAFAGYASTDYMLQSEFDAFGVALANVQEQLLAGGATEEEALEGVLGQLQDMVSVAEQYGFELDANTQALVDQATAAGYAFNTDPQIRMAEAMETVADRVGMLVELMGGTLPDAASRASSSFEGGMAQAAEASRSASDQMVEQFAEASEEIAASGDYIGIAWGGAIGELPIHVTETQTDVDAAFTSLETAIVGHANTAAAAVGGIGAAVDDALERAEAASRSWPSNWGSGPPEPPGGGAPPAHAMGTVTRGPELSWIGEQGAEVVAPVSALFGRLGNLVGDRVAAAMAPQMAVTNGMPGGSGLDRAELQRALAREGRGRSRSDGMPFHLTVYFDSRPIYDGLLEETRNGRARVDVRALVRG